MSIEKIEVRLEDGVELSKNSVVYKVNEIIDCLNQLRKDVDFLIKNSNLENEYLNFILYDELICSELDDIIEEL